MSRQAIAGVRMDDGLFALAAAATKANKHSRLYQHLVHSWRMARLSTGPAAESRPARLERHRLGAWRYPRLHPDGRSPELLARNVGAQGHPSARGYDAWPAYSKVSPHRTACAKRKGGAASGGEMS